MGPYQWRRKEKYICSYRPSCHLYVGHWMCTYGVSILYCWPTLSLSTQQPKKISYGFCYVSLHINLFISMHGDCVLCFSRFFADVGTGVYGHGLSRLLCFGTSECVFFKFWYAFVLPFLPFTFLFFLKRMKTVIDLISTHDGNMEVRRCVSSLAPPSPSPTVSLRTFYRFNKSSFHSFIILSPPTYKLKPRHNKTSAIKYRQLEPESARPVAFAPSALSK